MHQQHTDAETAEAATEHGIRLEVVKHTEAKRRFVLPPRRSVMERSFACVRYEHCPGNFLGLVQLACMLILLRRFE